MNTPSHAHSKCDLAVWPRWPVSFYDRESPCCLIIYSYEYLRAMFERRFELQHVEMIQKNNIR